jgi:hypothetical protein
VYSVHRPALAALPQGRQGGEQRRYPLKFSADAVRLLWDKVLVIARWYPLAKLLGIQSTSDTGCAPDVQPKKCLQRKLTSVSTSPFACKPDHLEHYRPMAYRPNLPHHDKSPLR